MGIKESVNGRIREGVDDGFVTVEQGEVVLPTLRLEALPLRSKSEFRIKKSILTEDML